MARSSFGDAFSRSFESTLATYRKEKESEQAEERLNRRMDRHREQDALDAASEQGIYLPEHLNPGGGYNIQTLKAETAKAKKLGLEAQQDAILEKTKLREQAERDRIAGDRRADMASLVARKYPDIAFDFAGDWEEQIKEHEAMVDFQKRQSISGMTPTPFTQQWYNERTGVSSKEKPPVVYGGPPETGIDLPPEPDKFRTSFEPGRVTPEMEGGLAEFQRKKAAQTLKGERQALVDFNLEQAGLASKAVFGALTPSAKNMFSRLYGDETITADPTLLAAQVVQADVEDKKEYNRLDERAKANISFINSNSKFIPKDSGFSFKFKDDGSPDVSSINEFNQRYSVEIDAFGKEKRDWLYGPLVPAKPDAAKKPSDSGLRTPNQIDGASGRPLNPLDLASKKQWGEEEKKLVDFWESNNTSSEMVGAAKAVFDAIPSPNVINPDALYGQAPKEGDLFSSPQGSRYYTSPGLNNIRVQQIAPRLGGLQDIDPSKESLFEAAISKLNEEDTLIKWKVEDSRNKTLMLRKGMESSPTETSMSGRDRLLKARQAQEQEINDSLKEEVDGVKASLMYRKLRNDLIAARVKEITSTYKGISKKEADEYVRDEEIKATLRGEEGRATQWGGGKSAKGEQRMREAISSKFRW